MTRAESYRRCAISMRAQGFFDSALYWDTAAEFIETGWVHWPTGMTDVPRYLYSWESGPSEVRSVYSWETEK